MALFGFFGALFGQCTGPDGPPDPPPPTTVCEALSDAASVGDPLPSPAGPPDEAVVVDLDAPAGAANQELTGLVWNSGPSLDAIEGLRPSMIRVDGRLQDRSTGPAQLDVQPLLDKLTEIHSVGAEPLVILSYMPRWLGQPSADARNPGANPTRMGPYDMDAWEQVVHDVVLAVATAPEPARMFEAWNEPDLPTFWLDDDATFVEMATRTHRAVAAVEQETGLDLKVGGPSLAFAPNHSGARVAGYVERIKAEGLPFDFWSWHRYANFPFLGPDGNEGHLPDALYAILGRINPDATPLSYSQEIREARAHVDEVFAGTGLDPELYIDEWNVSGGGLDLRHDSAVGAAFDAAILIEMERAGLDRAAFYRATGSSGAGDWAIVHEDGTPKPAWWLFRAWDTMGGDLLAVTDDPAAGLFARATRSPEGCVQVLVANFVAAGGAAHTVDIDLEGALPASRCEASVASLDAASTTFELARPVPLAAGGSVALDVPAQSVQLLRVDC